MSSIVELIFVVWWVHGVVVAKGFWLTLLCAIFPPASFVVSMSSLL